MLVDPDSKSPVKKGTPRADALLSQPMEGIQLDSDDEEDAGPLPRLDFGRPIKSRGGSSSEDEVAAQVLQRPAGLHKSETVSSIDSNADSLFGGLSHASSSTSLASDAGFSRKRAADGEPVSPSPPKCRKIESPAFDMNRILGEHGTALKTYIVFHDNEVQKKYDHVGVPFGAQWELARELSRKRPRWTLADIQGTTNAQFNGSNLKIAPHVGSLLGKRKRNRVPDKRELDMWTELDRELAATQEQRTRGLGLLPDKWDKWDRSASYYGGQITFPLRLGKNSDGEYCIVLEKPYKGRSYRFARLFGSTSLLHLSIPIEFVRDETEALRKFLTQRFVLNGRVYMALPPKDANSIYLIQTNMDWMRSKTSLAFWGDDQRLSFGEVLRRHNPPEWNAEQAVAKYATRFALGFSTSRPALELSDENIYELPDVLAEGCDPNAKPASEQVMTDGCGFMNLAARLRLKAENGYDNVPTAAQGRIAGCKGLWISHPTDIDPDAEPKIWIRDSQRKIKLHPEESGSRVHRIFDLLKVSHPPQTDARYELSEQAIMVLVKLLTDGLTEAVAPLFMWSRGEESGVSDMVMLWRAVERLGSVGSSRLQRIAGSRSRVLGLKDRDWAQTEGDIVDGDEELDEDDEDTRVAVRSGRDLAGGPLSLHERVMELIESGFHPAHCKYLNEKLKFILKLQIDSACKKHRISLPESIAADAFAIPDPTPSKLLQPGQIFYRSSKPFRHPKTQAEFHTLTGRVLVGRYPIRLPCDMQIVTAVDIPELYAYTDVMIASVRGERNYDGDTVILTWLDEFVDHFQNKPFTPAPDGFIDEYFERDVKTVKTLMDELASKSQEEAQQALQEHLVMGLVDSKVGMYSNFHDEAIYEFGYDHPNSILMAYMGNTLLDAGKSGLRLREGVFETHRAKFGKPPKDTTSRKGKAKDDIRSQLGRAAKATGDERLFAYEKLSETHNSNYKDIQPDSVLLKPYEDAKARSARAPAVREELGVLEEHVDAVLVDYKKIYPLQPDQKKLRTTIMLAAQVKYLKVFADCHSLGDDECIERIKASYAYSKDERFGFDIAFKALRSIKSRSMPGGSDTSWTLFNQLKTISGSAARAMQDEE
ncbi:RNA dependent RNA polymerase-domain-containing protein [Mycena amicta]|nr:RNA dependent RNA polymerase-domain-containing protein [Mycena amicta]